MAAKPHIVKTKGRESVRSQGLGAVGREILTGMMWRWVAGQGSLEGCLGLLD